MSKTSLRIAGVDIPTNKQLWVALTYVKGIGNVTSMNICKSAGVDPNIRVRDLTEEQAEIVVKHASDLLLEGELMREVIQNILRLKNIRCFRGMRHIKHLPCNGQRSKTNARTVKRRVGLFG